MFTNAELHNQAMICTFIKGNQAPNPFSRDQNISVNVITFYVPPPPAPATKNKKIGHHQTNTIKKLNHQSRQSVYVNRNARKRKELGSK